jgi:hypothetical protein
VPGNVISNIRSTEHPLFVMHLGKIVVQRTGAGDASPTASRAGAFAGAAADSGATGLTPAAMNEF